MIHATFNYYWYFFFIRRIRRMFSIYFQFIFNLKTHFFFFNARFLCNVIRDFKHVKYEYTHVINMMSAINVLKSFFLK